ncbi:MAG: DUF6174 domain-containing protein [Acidimicrobiales bacterium]
MHRPAHPRSLPFWWAAAGLLVLAACGFGGGGRGDPQAAQFARQRVRWEQERPDRYMFSLSRECFCPRDVTAARTVTVDGDEVVDVEPPDAGEQALTIDDLFEIVIQALADGDDVTVSFDERRAFPTSIAIDPSADVADDESGYRVEDFEALD